MSYSARFTLTWDDVMPEPFVAEVVAIWRGQHEEIQYCIDADGTSEEDGCWYKHPEHLKELSLRVSATLFTLDCVGEDGTRWRVLAKDGQVHEIKPVLIWPATPISPETRSE